MGCGCSEKPMTSRQAALKQQAQAAPKPRREGGIGERGYYWEGPRGRKPSSTPKS